MIPVASMSRKQKSDWKWFLFLILLIAGIKTLIFELFFVPTGSMKPSVFPGDLIFATKYNYGYSRHSVWPFSLPLPIQGRIAKQEPTLGDIIMFKATHKKETFVKRLIGKEHDKIQFINGKLYINEILVKKEFVKSFLNDKNEICHEYTETLPNGVMYKLIEHDTRSEIHMHSPVFFVPKDHYFFLGDNRDESGDSRFELSYVPSTNLVAKAGFVILSMEKFFLPKNFRKERVFMNLNKFDDK